MQNSASLVWLNSPDSKFVQCRFVYFTKAFKNYINLFGFENVINKH